MAAPRITQFVALRNLSRSNLQTRQLHMLAPTPLRSVNPEQQRNLSSRLHQKPQHEAAPVNARTFSLSGQKQAARDTSTIDFFYFPSIDHAEDEAADMIRVPLLPDNYNPQRIGVHAFEAELVVHKPEINVMSMDSVFLPMAENHDGHAMGVDFHAMADRVAANVRNMKVPVEEQASMMKQLWNDMVDDILGLKKKVAG